LSPLYIRVLQIDIGCKHDVFLCSKGIAECFENLEYVKPPNEGIVGSTLGVFSMMRNIPKLTHLMHVVPWRA
jgi:hypothetical protein